MNVTIAVLELGRIGKAQKKRHRIHIKANPTLPTACRPTLYRRFS